MLRSEILLTWCSKVPISRKIIRKHFFFFEDVLQWVFPVLVIWYQMCDIYFFWSVWSTYQNCQNLYRALVHIFNHVWYDWNRRKRIRTFLWFLIDCKIEMRRLRKNLRVSQGEPTAERNSQNYENYQKITVKNIYFLHNFPGKIFHHRMTTELRLICENCMVSILLYNVKNIYFVTVATQFEWFLSRKGITRCYRMDCKKKWLLLSLHARMTNECFNETINIMMWSISNNNK